MDSPSPAPSAGEQTGSSVAVAFAIAFGAGAFSMVGACMVYLLRTIKNKEKFIAASLGMATGVMVFVSFFELLAESRERFLKSSFGPTPSDIEEIGRPVGNKGIATLYMSLSFFGGGLFTIFFDILIRKLHQIDEKRQENAARNVDRNEDHDEKIECRELARSTLHSFRSCSRVSTHTKVESSTTSNEAALVSATLQGTSTLENETSRSSGFHALTSPLPSFSRGHAVGARDISSSPGLTPLSPLFGKSSIPAAGAFSRESNDGTLLLKEGSDESSKAAESAKRRLAAATSSSVSTLSSSSSEVGRLDVAASNSIKCEETSLNNRNDFGEGRLCEVEEGTSAAMRDSEKLRRESALSSAAANFPKTLSVHQERLGSCSCISTSSSSSTTAPSLEHTNKAVPLAELRQAGAIAALAIGLHNIPEGMTTFLALAKDHQLGVSVAIAIAIHNIPEGIAIAFPIYFGTNSMTKALLYALIATLAEPFGALLAWLFFSDPSKLPEAIFGIIYGIVAGMMTMVVFQELLPSAYRMDPMDSVTTFSITFGMAIMAASAVILEL